MTPVMHPHHRQQQQQQQQQQQRQQQHMSHGASPDHMQGNQFSSPGRASQSGCTTVITVLGFMRGCCTTMETLREALSPTHTDLLVAHNSMQSV